MESMGMGWVLSVIFVVFAAAGALALVVERWARIEASAKAGASAAARALCGALRRRWAVLSERGRLRVAAALLDAGNHLMLSDDERRAMRVEKKLRAAVHRGPARARRQARKLGAEAQGGGGDDFEVLCVPVAARTLAGGLRQLSLSCVLYPPFDPSDARDGCHFVWRVANGPAPDPASGRPGRGPTSYCEVPTLHQALVSYFAPPVRPGKDLFWAEEPASPEPHDAPLSDAALDGAQEPAAGPVAWRRRQENPPRGATQGGRWT